MKELLVVLGLFLSLASIASAAEGELSLPAREETLRGLRPEHPRLLATKDDFAALAARCNESEQLARWRDKLKGDAERLIDTPSVKYEIPDGKRLLRVSREAKDRVLLLALMHRLTQDPRFAERAWVELDTVTRFKDWNPSHFLDTAEMTFAVAIGYDWLYDKWSEVQRSQLRQAIVKMGLKPGLEVYRKRQWWSQAIHNWNQVCNGGMGIGALAIAEDEPELAAETLYAALQSLPLAMREFRPDGGWGEGPGYWRYATEYNVYFLAALRTALGGDFGLSQMPGFPATGEFPIHFNSPTGLTFNYADAHDSWRGAPQLFWMATTFDRPAYAAAQAPFATSNPSALDLLWGAAWIDRDLKSEIGALPPARQFTGVAVATMRSAWNDPRATFVGFKGGNNRVNHGQLDLGSFVLDALGVRWAVDLGPDDYNIPGYFGPQRWSYYRNMTEGHNTLVINGRNQSTTATAAITRFEASDEGATAVADLTKAWPDARRVLRSVSLIGRDVLVRDEIEAEKPVTVHWHMHTRAEVAVDGRKAVLTQDNETLVVEIVEPESARFTVAPATVTPPQLPLKNVQRLSIRLPANETALTVRFAPASP
ncbi:MAG: heparinase II/III family protein [Planctomycetales bacterium]|nr:heparinase II/III family protein [Planctomycetales bacterium]